MPIKLVVTGMHRSGTTWIGQVVSQLNDYAVIHEPFNFVHGLVGVPTWYLDDRSAAHRIFFHEALADLECGVARFQWHFNLRRPFKSIAAGIVGTGASRAYRKIIKQNPPHLAIKDPFLLRMAPILADEGYKVLVSVRHPGAVLRSLARMAWPTSINSLQDQTSTPLLEPLDDITRACDQWSSLYRPVLQYLERNDAGRIFIADHSVIFRDVEQFGASLIRFLNVTSGQESLMQFLLESTAGKTVTPSHDKLHDFSRDSRKLAESWRLDYNSEELLQFDFLVGSKLAKLAHASRTSITRFAP